MYLYAEILILWLLKIVINMILENVENEYFLRRVRQRNSLCWKRLLADTSPLKILWRILNKGEKHQRREINVNAGFGFIVIYLLVFLQQHKAITQHSTKVAQSFLEDQQRRNIAKPMLVAVLFYGIQF